MFVNETSNKQITLHNENVEEIEYKWYLGKSSNLTITPGQGNLFK